jgi:DNA-directed RNA polymerase III subunit RPC1
MFNGYCSFNNLQVLVDEQVKRQYLKRLRVTTLDGVRRKDILKSLNTLCKKTGSCPHCLATNGAVKKG